MNKKVFGTVKNPTDTINDAGGNAYELTPQQALAQMAFTGTFNGTYYADENVQVNRAKELIDKVSPQYASKVAVSARRTGYMKDFPAFILAALTAKGHNDVVASAWDRVIDSGKMLRNYVQIIRSGAVGRKSFGSAPKRLIRSWFDKDPNMVFKQSIGNDPSMDDVIKMVHPKPKTPEQQALFQYLLGKGCDLEKVPQIIHELEQFKASPTVAPIPRLDFRFLTNMKLPNEVWTKIAQQATWQQTRMNLNTFMRHGVFDDPKMVKIVADRLNNPIAIEDAKVFPYQLYTAYMNIDKDMPFKIKEALQDAAQMAIANVPKFDLDTVVCVDTSGSMSNNIMGNRGVTRAVDIAALFASSVLFSNPASKIIAFDTDARWMNLNPRDSLMTNTRLLALNGGGTDCSSAMKLIVDNKTKADLIIYVSDNESWLDSLNDAQRPSNIWAQRFRYMGGQSSMNSSTKTLQLFDQHVKRNPKCKMVCIDLVPNTTTQARAQKNILNIGGFSDNVFNVVSGFIQSDNDPDFWVHEIEKVDI